MKGPESNRFNPDENKGKPQKFKGGIRNGNETICKKEIPAAFCNCPWLCQFNHCSNSLN